ncbi:MAG TPA: hypothetical protein VM934_00955 [Pyrinomonadaceae bacterium]|jgi:hypothetical protein|nr:hypothetical protein [Pyrinomonadaceae bacterium]
MNTKTPTIKVIKRDQRNRQEAEPEEVKKSAPEAARDMVATVTEWVNEFQQKRRAETTQAIKMLLRETTPHTSKA